MTPMLEAQNISGLQKERPLLLLEENLEQLSIGNEEEYGWEDELEELSPTSARACQPQCRH